MNADKTIEAIQQDIALIKDALGVGRKIKTKTQLKNNVKAKLIIKQNAKFNTNANRS